MSKIKKIILMLTFFIAICIANKVYAGTSISITPSQPKVGETVTVTVTVSDVTNSDVHVTVSGVVSGNIAVVNSSTTGEKTSFSNSATFVPSMAGTITANTTESSNAISDGNYTDVAASSSVSVIENSNNIPDENNGDSSQGGTSNTNDNNTSEPNTSEVQLSNNANLSNLGIRPNDFSGFKPWLTSYNATVENDVTSVEVYATAQDSKSKLSGTGIKNLNEGNNAVSVTVTAEDGTKKTYTINVERKKADEEEKEEGNEENSETKQLGLSELQIEGLELTPEFKSDVYEYTVNYIGEDTKLNITAKSNNEDETIEIAGNENLAIGDNLVNIIVTDSTGENTVTYQLTVNKKLEDEEALANKIKDEEQRRNTKRAIVLGTALIIVLVIAIIILIKKARNKRLSEEYSSPYYEDDEEDNDEYDNDEYYEEDDTNNYFEDIEEQEEIEDEEETTTKIKKKKVKGKRFK